MQEEFKSLNRWYNISNFGRVYSTLNKRILKPYKTKDGYLRITIRSEINKRIIISIHRYVAILFLPNPNNLPYVDHKDRNKSNNTVENLRWVTISTNSHNTNISKTNTSGATGVVYHKKDNIWIAKIVINYKIIYLGSYDNFEDAKMARKNAENKYWKDLKNLCHV